MTRPYYPLLADLILPDLYERMQTTFRLGADRLKEEVPRAELQELLTPNSFKDIFYHEVG